LAHASTTSGVQNVGAVPLIPRIGCESTERVISSHGRMVIAHVPWFMTSTFGILGIVTLSSSTWSMTHVGATVSVFFGKKKLCTTSERRNARTKRLRILSLSIEN
jgi:hypothetical protein